MGNKYNGLFGRASNWKRWCNCDMTKISMSVTVAILNERLKMNQMITSESFSITADTKMILSHSVSFWTELQKAVSINSVFGSLLAVFGWLARLSTKNRELGQVPLSPLPYIRLFKLLMSYWRQETGGARSEAQEWEEGQRCFTTGVDATTCMAQALGSAS